MKTKPTASEAAKAAPETPAKPNEYPGSYLNMPELDKSIAAIADMKVNSTARYFSISADGTMDNSHVAVCFHSISGNVAEQNHKGFGIVFQGYGGFEKGDRWRAATEADLYTNIPIPFVMVDGGHYNKESLAWLECLLDPEGPFKSLLPHMLETDPEAVQSRRCFIFPDSSSIPARLTWCFAIASRLGFANPRVLWRYLHLLDKGLDKRTAFLISGGFEHQIVAGKPTGKIIKSYTCGFLGADVTAYAGRMLTSSPAAEKPGASKNGTYGSSEVFKSGDMDFKKMTFEDWNEVIEYVQQRGREQAAKLGITEPLPEVLAA